MRGDLEPGRPELGVGRGGAGGWWAWARSSVSSFEADRPGVRGGAASGRGCPSARAVHEVTCGLRAGPSGGQAPEMSCFSAAQYQPVLGAVQGGTTWTAPALRPLDGSYRRSRDSMISPIEVSTLSGEPGAS